MHTHGLLQVALSKQQVHDLNGKRQAVYLEREKLDKVDSKHYRQLLTKTRYVSVSLCVGVGVCALWLSGIGNPDPGPDPYPDPHCTALHCTALHLRLLLEVLVPPHPHPVPHPDRSPLTALPSPTLHCTALHPRSLREALAARRSMVRRGVVKSLVALGHSEEEANEQTAAWEEMGALVCECVSV